ncbi:transporter [Taibaiella sp. KBW10]|uniref:BON domain-containing protein n=1 Tax=Taibaiella sp. KBW10 TaxID=2153357 RepID=UPI000F5A96B4|nr:BON domain-containing protein [Taibaiella sp. KBW10]RQO30258.1 transporter [Taibaiella sp. KBW10]
MTIKKLIPVLMITGAIAMTMPSCKSKVADTDVKAKVEAVMIPGVTVDVKDGVVTLNGAVTSDADKASAEAAVKALDEKSGVKSVVNNITVAAPAPPPPASVTTTLDAATQQKVNDGLKDIKGVTVTYTVDPATNKDKAVVSGEVTKADRVKIMQILASAKVKSDVSNLKDKK